VTRECWARCETCHVDIPLGCVVPCPLEVYIAAVKAAICPICGETRKLFAYSPGFQPPCSTSHSPTADTGDTP
jgi:hypothetical protein